MTTPNEQTDHAIREDGWPDPPERPWSIIIAAGSLALGPARNRDDDPNPVFITCEELTARLRMPVVAANSTPGTPPYIRSGHGERPGVPAADVADIRAALRSTREMFAEPPAGVTTEAALRQWCVTQLHELRALLERAETALAAGEEWPGDVAFELADAATAYADALFAWDVDVSHDDEESTTS
jgi:hypothetical protein